MKFTLTWIPLFGEKIPDNLQVEIVGFLSSVDLTNCFSVSKNFYQSLKVFALLTNINVGIMDNHINYGMCCVSIIYIEYMLFLQIIYHLHLHVI